MTDFDEFDEFDQRAQQNIKQQSERLEWAEAFPHSKALVEGLRASFPELFKGAKVIHMVEKDTGREYSRREYRLVSHFTALPARSFFEFGRLIRLNEMATTKRAARKQAAKYVIVPGYVISRNDQQRHYVSAPRLADLYRVNFQECRVFTRTDNEAADRAAWKRFKDEGYIFLRVDATGKYALPAGGDDGR
jgi:hypothetical protein